MQLTTLQRLARMTDTDKVKVYSQAQIDGRLHTLPCKNPRCWWHHTDKQLMEAGKP